MYLKDPNYKTKMYVSMYTFVYGIYTQGNASMKDYLYAYALYLMVWVQRQKLNYAENDAKKNAKGLIVIVFKYMSRSYVKRKVGSINPFTNYKIFKLDDDNAFKAFLESNPFSTWDRISKHARLVGKAASEFKNIHNEVRYRPEHSGANEAKLHFERAAHAMEQKEWNKKQGIVKKKISKK